MKIRVNDIQVNYELSGKEGGPVVVLSHSLSSNLSMWNPQMEILEKNFRVLRYDTRGHGGSDAPSGAYNMDMLGGDAVGMLDALGIEKVHWVGLSMGGMIAQCLALNYADRLKSLSLCDTAATIPEEAQQIWQERIDMVRKKGMQALVQGTMERWFTPPFLKQNPPEVDLIREQVLATPVTGFVGCIEAIRRLNYLERLSEIKKPTLIMVGEQDPGTPVALSEAIHNQIQESELVVIPSAAHMSNVEQPEAFNRSLMSFLLEQ